MREICTSGSTRGGALRSPPTLPARPSRARQQALEYFEQPVYLVTPERGLRGGDMVLAAVLSRGEFRHSVIVGLA